MDFTGLYVFFRPSFRVGKNYIEIISTFVSLSSPDQQARKEPQLQIGEGRRVKPGGQVDVEERFGPENRSSGGGTPPSLYHTAVMRDHSGSFRILQDPSGSGVPPADFDKSSFLCRNPICLFSHLKPVSVHLCPPPLSSYS